MLVIGESWGWGGGSGWGWGVRWGLRRGGIRLGLRRVRGSQGCESGGGGAVVVIGSC